MAEAYRLMIGSVGDDSHSVGMALLEIAFREAGYYVKNLSILNELDDFFFRAKEFDAIFISCVNGHADLYIENFKAKLMMFQMGNAEPKVWYIGGNLSVKEDNESVIRKYRDMGFDYAAPKPVAVETIMENLEKDFYRKGIKKKKVNDTIFKQLLAIPFADTVDDAALTDTDFHNTRIELLSSWPTGKQVWDTDIKKNHSEPHKNMHNVILSAMHRSATPIIQPRTGVSHTSDEIEILQYLRKHGLDISSIQLDAASRKNRYLKAQEGVMKTEVGKTSFLNGYPVPIHGVDGIEKIMDAIDTPFQIRAGSPDHRLAYEIGLAGGASAVEGGFICYLYPYDKNTSPVDNLLYWKYIDKLVDQYKTQYNIVINREYFGPLTCCLIEPTIPICINIVQAILSAKWGAECISVGLAEQGNRDQDIAAIRVLDKMTRFFLKKYGFSNCTVSTVYHHYMAAFPTDREKARNLILNSSITGTLANATRFMTKTSVESIHIPTKEDNAEGLALTREGILMSKDVILDMAGVQKEIQLLERQVFSMMSSIEKLGRGSIARGAIKAFEIGLLDIPFSPSKFNKGELMGAKDCNGAIRFINPEKLPFSNDIMDFHQEKIHERMTKQRVSKIHQVLESDLTRIWKNDYISWPVDGHYIV
jgi:methylaspartate mutase epsilon subunit